MAESGTQRTVANSREERDKVVAHLAGMRPTSLMHELVAWTVASQDLVEESRDLRARKGEARAMLELITVELRGRQASSAPVEGAA